MYEMPPTRDCGCGSKSDSTGERLNPTAFSWIELAQAKPADPVEIVLYASLAAIDGTYSNSSTFNTPGTWIASPATLSAVPTIISLATDAAVTSAYAAQWTLSHLTANIGATVAPPLRRVIYLKAGRAWTNKISIQLGGATYDSFQLSFRDNAATRGDASGTIPVIAFNTSQTGVVTLDVTLQRPLIAMMGLVMRNASSGDWNMFEMEWRVVK